MVEAALAAPQVPAGFSKNPLQGKKQTLTNLAVYPYMAHPVLDQLPTCPGGGDRGGTVAPWGEGGMRSLQQSPGGSSCTGLEEQPQGHSDLLVPHLHLQELAACPWKYVFHIDCPPEDIEALCRHYLIIIKFHCASLSQGNDTLWGFFTAM